jgi:hypothetical protein
LCQSGSPNGLETGNPGYVFTDEFNASVRHDGPGVLSMANSGPQSNGSQFFITVSSRPSLNDVHTIFGRVVNGQAVVDAMNNVPTDANDKPLVPIVIQSVFIRRVGEQAQIFNIDTQGLPIVSQVPLSIARSAGNVALTLPNSPFAWQHLRESPDLKSWSATALGVELTPPAFQNVTRPLNAPARFFSLTRVQYPTSTFAPSGLQNRRLILNFDGGLGTLTIDFDETRGGVYALSFKTPGTVESYEWMQRPYRGFLWPIYFSTLVPMTLRLDFSDETTGRISGTAYAAAPFHVSGPFLLGP